MGRRGKQQRQERLWIAYTELPRTVAHPFYEQLTRLLDERGFDEFVEQQRAVVSTGLGFLICLFIWIHLSNLARVAGSIWMVAGIAYGAWRGEASRKIW